MTDFPMKITLPISALAAILGLALAGAPVTLQAQTTNAPAATTPAAAAPAPATKPAKVTKTPYKGTLTAVDTTGNTITISTSMKDPTKTLTLSIAPTTKISKDKAPATLADFTVGEKVTGSYTKDATSGTMTAASLRFNTPKVKTPAAPVTTAPATPAAPAAPAAPMTQ